jgi:lipoate-protein ligase A
LTPTGLLIINLINQQQTMIFINHFQTNPFFNIAAEEYLLKNFNDDFLFVWQNSPSVIVGKHQNLIAEVNLKYTRLHEIPVIRRISGGGTVYHDLGNFNYTHIRSEANRERLIDFNKFSSPIMSFLKTMGIETGFGGKNNLITEGRKFSGNSAHVFKNRVMHHGTLLFNTDLTKLEKVIRPPKAQIDDKSVKSIRASVINLSDVLSFYISPDEFRNKLTDFLTDHYLCDRIYEFTEEDKMAINKLVDEKYANPDWNYGYSPAYEFKNSTGDYHLFIKVKNGRIIHVDLTGFTQDIANAFKGIMHRFEDIENTANNISLNSEKKQILLHLFGF